MRKVNVEKVIERSSEIDGGLEDNSIRDFLDITEEEHTQASDLVEEGLKEVHQQKKHGNLDEWAKNGPFGVEVFAHFNLDYDVFEELIEENRLQGRFSKLFSQVWGESMSEMAKGKQDIGEVKENAREALSNPEKYGEDMDDDIHIWTCVGFMEMGETKVELERFIAAHYLFKLNYQHKVETSMKGAAQKVKNMFKDLV